MATSTFSEQAPSSGPLNSHHPDGFLTVVEVAERLKINDETVRRLFLNEPGVVIICFPRKGKRVYRTVRIPEAVFQRVVTRLSRVA